MTENEVKEFWLWFNIYFRERKQRKGQAMMNSLRQVAPVLYNDITGSYHDCFYRDDKVGSFRDYLGI